MHSILIMEHLPAFQLQTNPGQLQLQCHLPLLELFQPTLCFFKHFERP